MNDDWRLQHLFDKDSIRPVHFWSRIRPARRPGTKGSSYWIRKVDYDKNVVIPPLNLRDRAIVLRNLCLCFSGRYWADKAPTDCWTAFTRCIEHTQPITVGHLLLSWAKWKNWNEKGLSRWARVWSSPKQNPTLVSWRTARRLSLPDILCRRWRRGLCRLAG